MERADMTEPSQTDDEEPRPPIRLPRGRECECRVEGCGLFFSSESAFQKHFTRRGHVHPSEVGLIERTNARGPVWGFAGEKPVPGRPRTFQEGPEDGSDG
jgi:hypothetical protein